MKSCTIVKKDGAKVCGTLWALNRETWCFEIIEDESGERLDIPMGDCQSAIEHRANRTAATMGQDEDLITRAVEWGWKRPNDGPTPPPDR